MWQEIWAFVEIIIKTNRSTRLRTNDEWAIADWLDYSFFYTLYFIEKLYIASQCADLFVVYNLINYNFRFTNWYRHVYFIFVSNKFEPNLSDPFFIESFTANVLLFQDLLTELQTYTVVSNTLYLRFWLFDPNCLRAESKLTWQCL